MTAFLLLWPSVTLAELGDPRPRAPGHRPSRPDLLDDIEERIAEILKPLIAAVPSEGIVDQRWYWAAPLFLDQRRHPSATHELLAKGAAVNWERAPGEGFLAHFAEARAMLDSEPRRSADRQTISPRFSPSSRSAGRRMCAARDQCGDRTAAHP